MQACMHCASASHAWFWGTLHMMPDLTLPWKAYMWFGQDRQIWQRRSSYFSTTSMSKPAQVYFSKGGVLHQLLAALWTQI